MASLNPNYLLRLSLFLTGKQAQNAVRTHQHQQLALQLAL